MYIAFLLLWIIFNGRVTLEILLIGIALCSALFLFCCRFLGYSARKDIRMLKLTPLIAEYIVTLIAEIMKANRQVLHYIVTPVYQVEPRIVHFKVDLKTESARVILANSITLTPGTITVGLEDADFYVHCLDSDFDTDLETSVFVKLLKKMEAVE